MIRKWDCFVKVLMNEQAVIVHRNDFHPVHVLDAGWHFLKPWEYAIGNFHLFEPPVQVTNKHVSSCDGIPFSVDWSLTFGIDLHVLLAKSPGPMTLARLQVLQSTQVQDMIVRQCSECMQLVFGQHRAIDLCGPIDRNDLCEKVRLHLLRRLADVGLLIHQFGIGEIAPPISYKQALAQVQRERLKAHAKVVAQTEYAAMTSEEWSRMILLEHLRILKEHGYPPIYMMPGMQDTFGSYPNPRLPNEPCV